jgi:iron(III) transport system ATP-binding protein
MYLSLDQIVNVFPARGGSGEVVAVDGVSLGIEKGELVTLLGPSGCGKTTTLRIIAGFEFPTRGQILLDGKEINNLPPNRRDMSMVFQSYAIFPHLNVFENIAYGLNVQRLSKGEIQSRMGRVMDLVQLSGYENRAPNQLSGGQQQRVALARALVMEPKVLLMDEPLSNLDAKLREQMRTEIRRIQRELGITSVYVTHDQIEAMTLSDRVVVMNEGVIEQVGTPTEVYRHPNTRFIANFIGRANFIPGKALRTENGSLWVDALGQTFRVPAPAVSFPMGSPLSLVVRPEMIRLSEAAGPGADELRGAVHQSAYLGNTIDYTVEVNGQKLLAAESEPAHMTLYPEGAPVKVELNTDFVHVIQ